jgi:hypothetical protein
MKSPTLTAAAGAVGLVLALTVALLVITACGLKGQAELAGHHLDLEITGGPPVGAFVGRLASARNWHVRGLDIDFDRWTSGGWSLSADVSLRLLAAASAIGVAVLTLLARRLRRRAEAGHCPACGYDLTGNVSGVCPECGTPRLLARRSRSHN